MASKKASKILQGRTGQSIVERLERAVSTVANAASVAATGSELGVLELAVEDDIGVRKSPRPRKRPRKTAAKKTVAKKASARKTASKRRKVAPKRSLKPTRKPAKKKRVARRRSR
jgi:hypothetical protein